MVNIVSEYETGSSVLPYLKRHNKDIDLLIIVDQKPSREERLAIKAKIQQKYKALSNRVDVHIEALQDERCINEYYYLKHYLKLLDGKDLQFDDIFVLKNKLMSICQLNMAFFNRYGLKPGAIPKSIYHILTLLYIFDNKSYDLTKEQIKNIQLCYDRHCTQEILDYIFNKLK